MQGLDVCVYNLRISALPCLAQATACSISLKPSPVQAPSRSSRLDKASNGVIMHLEARDRVGL